MRMVLTFAIFMLEIQSIPRRARDLREIKHVASQAQSPGFPNFWPANGEIE